MALQTEGQISLEDIAVELGRPGTQISLQDADVLALINASSGDQVSLTDFYGASSIPSPVARVYWEEPSSTDPSTVGLVPSASVIANALTPSGAPPNISSTATQIGGLFLSNLYYARRLQLLVNPTSSTAQTRFYNPKAEYLYDVSSWSTIDTDLLCKIKFTCAIFMTNPNDVSGVPTHAAYYRPSPSGSLTTFATGSGSTFTGNVTFTTTATVNDYITAGADLELRAYWAVGGNSAYMRYLGTQFRCDISVQKVEFVL